MLFLFFGVMSVALGRSVDFFADHYIGTVIVSIIISLGFALLAEKGLWRKMALGLIVLSILLIILLFLVMGHLWNEP